MFLVYFDVNISYFLQTFPPSEHGGSFSYNDGVDIGDGIAPVGAKFGAGNEYSCGTAFILKRMPVAIGRKKTKAHWRR